MIENAFFLQGIECGCISCKIIKENRNILFSTHRVRKVISRKKKDRQDKEIKNTSNTLKKNQNQKENDRKKMLGKEKKDIMTKE